MTIEPTDPAVNRLAGVIARDVDELLTIILGYAELSLAAHGPAGPGAAEDLRVVQAAGERARALTNRLHTLGGRRVVRAARLDLGAALRAMLPHLEDLAGPDVAVDIRCGPGPAPVEIDPDLLEQSVGELVTNASEAMGGRGTVTLRVQPTALPSGRRGISLVVSDDGCGMEPGDLERCRLPLFTTKAAGATGLGLAIADAAARQAGGTLDLRSTPSQGTSVTLCLPRAPGAPPGGQGSNR